MVMILYADDRLLAAGAGDVPLACRFT